MDNNNKTEEKIQDLSLCSICHQSYNEENLKPKMLLCNHTFCLQCLKDKVPPPFTRLSCPKCEREFNLSLETADSCPTNLYVLSYNFQQQHIIVDDPRWCQTFGSRVKKLPINYNNENTGYVAPDDDIADPCSSQSPRFNFFLLNFRGSFMKLIGFLIATAFIPVVE